MGHPLPQTCPFHALLGSDSQVPSLKALLVSLRHGLVLKLKFSRTCDKYSKPITEGQTMAGTRNDNIFPKVRVTSRKPSREEGP